MIAALVFLLILVVAWFAFHGFGQHCLVVLGIFGVAAYLANTAVGWFGGVGRKP